MFSTATTRERILFRDNTLLKVLAALYAAGLDIAKIEGFDLKHEREDVRRHVAILGHASYTYDALSALEQWVEQGKPPDRIVASRVTDGSENLMGALRQSMAALGARTIGEMQRVEMVYAPAVATEGKSWQQRGR